MWLERPASEPVVPTPISAAPRLPTPRHQHTSTTAQLTNVLEHGEGAKVCQRHGADRRGVQPVQPQRHSLSAGSEGRARKIMPEQKHLLRGDRQRTDADSEMDEGYGSALPRFLAPALHG